MLRIGRRLAACVALAVLAVAACGQDEVGTSTGACAAPHLTVESATVARGDELTVSGTGFSKGCADNCSVDIDTDHMECETASPHSAITVELVPDDGQPMTLARLDADDDGAFTLEVTVPDDAPEGLASITADVVSSEPVELTIVP